MSGAERFDADTYLRRVRELRAKFFDTPSAPPPSDPNHVAPDGAPWYWNDLEAMPPPQRCMAIKLRYADRYGYTVEQLEGRRRYSSLTIARHKAMAHTYVVNPHWSLAKIGLMFGGRDHTSVLHAVQRMKVHVTREPLMRFCHWPRRSENPIPPKRLVWESLDQKREYYAAQKRAQWLTVKADPERHADYKMRQRDRRRAWRAEIKQDPVRFAEWKVKARELSRRRKARDRARKAEK